MYDNYKGQELLDPKQQDGSAQITVAPDTKKAIRSSGDGWDKRTTATGAIEVMVPKDVQVYKDVKIQFDSKGMFGGSSRVFSFWFHTGFIRGNKIITRKKRFWTKPVRKKGLKDFTVTVEFEPMTAELQKSSSQHAISEKIINNKIPNEITKGISLEPQLTNSKITDEKLVVLGICLQYNIEIRNRVWSNAAYKDVFIGAEAAVWLSKSGFDLKEVLNLGTRMT
eukprot:UN00865